MTLVQTVDNFVTQSQRGNRIRKIFYLNQLVIGVLYEQNIFLRDLNWRFTIFNLDFALASRQKIGHTSGDYALYSISFCFENLLQYEAVLVLSSLQHRKAKCLYEKIQKFLAGKLNVLDLFVRKDLYTVQFATLSVKTPYI